MPLWSLGPQLGPQVALASGSVWLLILKGGPGFPDSPRKEQGAWEAVACRVHTSFLSWSPAGSGHRRWVNRNLALILWGTLCLIL